MLMAEVTLVTPTDAVIMSFCIGRTAKLAMECVAPWVINNANLALEWKLLYETIPVRHIVRWCGNACHVTTSNSTNYGHVIVQH